ncbi:hypothetical protein CHISP_3529 [Chitinispirillum alkaliphilum]|nr:hypothetical protein CHISP_3529 [Chitinispirillum alkaliphilum]
MIGFVSLCLFVLYGLLIIGFGHVTKYSIADLCVVLGSKVNEDGTLSDRLKARLDKSIDLYNKAYFNKIIVSGGLGREGFEEAEVMRLYLLKNGVEEGNIIVDNNGNNTFMTAKFTAEYMSDKNYETVLVVSQYFHLFRTQLILKKLGVKNVKCASPAFYESVDFFSVVREMAAILKYLLI